MVKLTCKFPTIQNVALIVLKHYLLEFNWYQAITQSTHPVNVLTTMLAIKQSVSVSLSGGAWYSYCCGQTVGWIKMPLGKEVGLSPGHIVLDGTQTHSSFCLPTFSCSSMCAKNYQNRFTYATVIARQSSDIFMIISKLPNCYSPIRSHISILQ